MRTPLVSDRTFILAARDTGYRSLAAAVAELMDNALQAGARTVRIFVTEELVHSPQYVTAAGTTSMPRIISPSSGTWAVALASGTNARMATRIVA